MNHPHHVFQDSCATNPVVPGLGSSVPGVWSGVPSLGSTVSISVFCFLLSAFSVAAAAPKFADYGALIQAPTNAAAPTSAVPSTPAPKPAVTNAMDALDDQHKLSIGDRLSFRIVEDEEDPRPLVVSDLGDLEVPYIGRYPALGKTCKELARALKAELEKEYYYNATVIVAVDVMAKTRGRVYLVGPVRMPGPQEIPTDEVLTLSKAILRAGGFNDFADKKNVKVTRKSGGADKGFVVDVAEILEKGRTEADLPLEPGDLIYIPERLIRF